MPRSHRIEVKTNEMDGVSRTFPILTPRAPKVVHILVRLRKNSAEENGANRFSIWERSAFFGRKWLEGISSWNQSFHTFSWKSYEMKHRDEWMCLPCMHRVENINIFMGGAQRINVDVATLSSKNSREGSRIRISGTTRIELRNTRGSHGTANSYQSSRRVVSLTNSEIKILSCNHLKGAAEQGISIVETRARKFFSLHRGSTIFFKNWKWELELSKHTSNAFYIYI